MLTIFFSFQKCVRACISEQLSGQYNRKTLINAFCDCHTVSKQHKQLYRNCIYSNFILKSPARLARPIDKAVMLLYLGKITDRNKTMFDISNNLPMLCVPSDNNLCSRWCIYAWVAAKIWLLWWYPAISENEKKKWKNWSLHPKNLII